MQVMPGVATEYGVEDPFEPAQSISAGERYMKALLRRYHGDRTLAAAAYNAGISTGARYGGVQPSDETRTRLEERRDGKVVETRGRYEGAACGKQKQNNKRKQIK